MPSNRPYLDWISFAHSLLDARFSWRPRSLLPTRAAHPRLRIRAPRPVVRRHLTGVRSDFPHADFAEPFTVFNVGGNKYRLVTVIKYRWQIVYVRHILTHKKYTRGNGKYEHTHLR